MVFFIKGELMEELKKIIIDAIGTYVDPEYLEITETISGNYAVVSKQWLFSDDQLQAREELDAALEGTKYENKVSLYWSI